MKLRLFQNRILRGTVLIFIALFLIIIIPSCNNNKNNTEIKNGKDLLNAMVSMYKDKRHKTMTFSQYTVKYPEGKPDTTVWHEAMADGNLRIDTTPFDNKSGALFINETLYQFKDGKMVNKTSYVNPLKLFLADIYYYKPDRSFQLIDSLGYDLNKMYETSWQGKTVYVVGTDSRSDTTSKQFWVDKDNLYLVRVIDKIGNNLLDSHITGIKKMNDEWVENEIEIYLNGKIYQIEKYFDIKTNVKLDPNLFNSDYWAKAKPYWD